jgi:hypothetical protein
MELDDSGLPRRKPRLAPAAGRIQIAADNSLTEEEFLAVEARQRILTRG